MQRAIPLLLCWLFSGSLTAGDELVVRAEVQSEQAWLGQRVVLQIDVLAADGWAQVTGFGRLEMPGAYLLLPRDQGIRLQETIEGTSHTGQRYELSIYPQRAGHLQLTAEPIEVRVRRLGVDGAETSHSVTLPEISVDSRVPPGAEGVDGLISSRELKGEQQWVPQQAELEIGDSLKRIVHLRAADVPGMAFPPLRHAPIDGLGIYPAEARVEDEHNRGALTGFRTETVTYLAERAGRYTLPAIELAWWDSGSEQLQRIELPGMTLSVSGSSSAPLLPGPSGEWAGRLPWWALAMLPLAVALSLLRRPLMARRRAWSQARAESEARYFRLLEASVRTGRPGPIYSDLMGWLDRIEATERPARLDRFLERHAPPGSAAVFAPLQAGLSDNRTLTNRDEMLDVLRQARKRWQQGVPRNRPVDMELPPLNPGMIRSASRKG